VGEPVLDRTLVLTVLHRLNEQFGYMAALLKCFSLPLALDMVKRVLRYLGIMVFSSFTLLRPPWRLTVMPIGSGCPDTRCSTSSYGVFLGDKLVSWSSKCQQMVSCSSAEAEYRAVANAIAETCWLRMLLKELHCPIQRSVHVYCDNISVATH
jgi:hypothetical protein